jgi:accessory gene regulator protein AgrB
MISGLIFKDKKFQWLFFPYIFGIIGGIIPCFLIELNEYYLIEINVHPTLIGATARASLLCTIFLISTYIFTKILDANIQWNLKGVGIFNKIELKCFKLILILEKAS